MSRILTSVLAALGILAAVVATYVVVDRTTGGDQLETTTARGLAAGVMVHLGDREVTDVAGSSVEGYLTVSIGTTDPAVDSVVVTVDPTPAPDQGICGLLRGYETHCSNNPLREVGRRYDDLDGADRLGVPRALYVGTAQHGTRGTVSVYLYGSEDVDRDAAIALVEGIIDDPLIGATTSSRLNDEGEAIDDFEPLDARLEVSLDDAGTAPGAVEPTTPRGLAVAVIDHLGGRHVTSVGVGGDARHPIVSVDTDDPAVASVLVMVGPPLGGPLPCGADAGYTSVSCSTDPPRQVVRRTPRGRQPTYIGRVVDPVRQSVYIAVDGDRNTPAVAALVRALVDDELLGAVTSARRNARGADLVDVERLTLTSTLEVAPGPR